MAAFVVLALAVAVAVLAVAGVAAVQLLRTVQTLNARLAATRDRLAPLADELRSELAVASTEAEHLRGGLDRLDHDRQRLAHQRRRARARRRPHRTRA